MSTTAPQPRHTVTAIIVAHDGAQLLPGLVQALQAQTHPVDQTVGVDTGSRDRGGAVLAELLGQDAVFGMDRSTGYGEAVAVALRHATRRRPRTNEPTLGKADWVWLLHDDCEPAPDALEKLLRAADRDHSVVVVGPKVLDFQDRRTLREVGVSIDRAGRRVTGIDPGEIDQGQHDHKRDVLAVGSAGMLVRRDVWDRLGGFDTRLKLFRDDVDFCWRVQAAGLRVHVATDAVLYHRELSARRRRPTEFGSMRRLDRRNALFVLAVNLPLLAMLRVVGGCIAGSLVRAFYFLLTKQVDQSAAYAFSVLYLFAYPMRLFRGRRRRAAGFAEGYAAVRLFIPPARTVTRLAEKIAALASNSPPQVTSGRHQATAEEPEEDEQFVEAHSVVRRIIGHPGVRLFAALLLISLVAERRLLAATPLGGGALVPAWGGAAALWQEYLAGFHAVGVGSTASAPAYLAVVAGLATVLGGQAWLAVDVLLLGCVPLAGLTAYVASRWVATATPARVLLAASYALLPVATGAVAAGRLGTAVAFTVLPLIAVSAGRMLTTASRQARRAAWATGLLIGVGAAFAPLIWVLGAVLAVGALAVRRWLVAVNPVNAAIVAAAPFLVLFPWSLHLLTSPSAFLAEAGVSTPGLTAHGLAPTALLALSPGGPGLPPAWVTAGFGLALLALVLPLRRAGLLIAGWAVAIAGLLAAAVISAISVSPPAGGAPADGWPGTALAVAALGLLLASAPAAQWLATINQNGSGDLSPASSHRPGGYGRVQRLLAAAPLAAAATAPLLVAAFWVTGGVRGPVGAVTAPLLPAYVAATSATGAQYRTLILRPDGAGLDYQVVRQGDPTLGEPELAIASGAAAALNREVAALGAPDGADAGDPGLVLGEFGIRWVLLPGPVDPVLAQRLDAAVGLVALSKAAAYDLWQVAGTVARARVVAAGGATTALPSNAVNMSATTAPASGGTLILAEPYGGWAAALNGKALKPLAAPVDGWAQGFVLPPGGGQLSITRNNLARAVSLIGELFATVIICLLALPGKRADPVAEAEALAALREARNGRRAASLARRAGRPARAGGIRAVRARGIRAGAIAAGSGSVRAGSVRAGSVRVGGGGHRAAGVTDWRPYARRRRADQGPAAGAAAGTPAEAVSRPGQEPASAESARSAAVIAAGRTVLGAGASGADTRSLPVVFPGETAPGAHEPGVPGDEAGLPDLREFSMPGLPWDMAGDWGSQGPQAMSRSSGQQPASRQTGPQRPPWESDPGAPSGPSGRWGPAPQSPALGTPVPRESGRQLPRESGLQRTDRESRPQPPRESGPQPPRESGPQPPRESRPQPPREPGPDAIQAPPEPEFGSSPWPAATRPEKPAKPEKPEKPERHSHRAPKHSRPSRRRGPGNRSGGDGES